MDVYSKALGHVIKDFVRGMEKLRPQERLQKRALLPSDCLPLIDWKAAETAPDRVQQALALLIVQLYFGWRASTVVQLRAAHVQPDVRQHCLYVTEEFWKGMHRGARPPELRERRMSLAMTRPINNFFIRFLRQRNSAGDKQAHLFANVRNRPCGLVAGRLAAPM